MASVFNPYPPVFVPLTSVAGIIVLELSGRYYSVRLSYGPGSDSWLPGREVESLAALDNFLRERGELPG